MMFSIVCILLFTQFFSCYRDIIDLDLGDFAPQIVIESIITDQPGPYLVRISKTGELNQFSNFPWVSGAEVILQDNSGNSETLIETATGQYKTRNLQGIPGRTYDLKAKVEGKEYAAVSRMPEPLFMDYISFQNLGWGYIMVCAFTDRQGIEDFCRIKIFKNGELAERYLYQGKYNDGEQIVIDDFETYFSAGDQVRVELFTINKETFVYLSQLNPDEGGGDYDPNYPEYMVVSLSNPKSNLSNKALGYFSAQSVRNYTRIVR
jgi:Domain of unknown function (DUF4249)